MIASALLVLSTTLAAAGPVDDLLARVPADAGLTVVVDDLRGGFRKVRDSPLVAAWRGIPAVRAWLQSPAIDNLREARDQIETGLGLDLAVARDAILGDAVVLSLQGTPGGQADDVHGVLLTRFRDRAMLDKIIAAANRAETDQGNLDEVRTLRSGAGGSSIWHRRFRPGTKPDEWYAIEGETFAWSNAEALILRVMSSKPEGLAQSDSFQAVRAALPPRGLIQVYLNPRFFGRVIAEKNDPGANSVLGLLAATNYAGATLNWSDGPKLQGFATLDPTKIPEPLRRWASRPGSLGSRFETLPKTAIAAVAWDVDLGGLVDHLLPYLPATNREKLEAGLTVLNGVFLGRDVRREILPAIGPSLLAVFHAPDAAGERFEMTLDANLGGGEPVATAVANGLKTMWGLIALTPAASGLRLESDGGKPGRVVTLVGGPRPLSYGVVPGRIVLGSGPGVVADRLTAEKPTTTSRLAAIRTASCPDSETFLVVDFEALTRAADARRAALAQGIARLRGGPMAEAQHDLDQVLHLARTLRGGAVAVGIDPRATSASLRIEISGPPPR